MNDFGVAEALSNILQDDSGHFRSPSISGGKLPYFRFLPNGAGGLLQQRPVAEKAVDIAPADRTRD